MPPVLLLVTLVTSLRVLLLPFLVASLVVASRVALLVPDESTGGGSLAGATAAIA